MKFRDTVSCLLFSVRVCQGRGRAEAEVRAVRCQLNFQARLNPPALDINSEGWGKLICT